MTQDTPTADATMTTGEIAKVCGVDRWQVLACLKRNLLAEPAGRVGPFRVWAAADVARVRAALEAGGYLAAGPDGPGRC